jgi:4-carboxymuconolactone decarboxylase
MAISERAQQNHDELFPGHVSTLKVKRSRTDRVLRQLCVRRGAASREPGHQDTAHGAAGIHDRLPGAQGVMLGAALTVDVTPVEVKEIVYHAVPYVGMYKVFDFIHATNDVLTERGVELPLPGQSTTTPEDRMEKGLSVQKKIVGAEAVKGYVRRSTRGRDAHPALPIRELLRGPLHADWQRPAYARTAQFSMLVSIGGCEPQVKGHVSANLNIGNDRARLIDVVTQLLPFIGYPRTLNGLRMIDEVTLA